MRGRRGLSAVAVLMVLLASCGGSEGEGGAVELEFFQFKPEAIATFDRIIADFNANHPGIQVTQNSVPAADTAIRIRLVRGDVPDVMTLNGNFTFGELAKAGVFHDFANDPVVEDVSPAILKILTDLGVNEEGQVNGLPFANNADGVIYNKDLFAENGLEAPTTWDEMLTALETFEEAGVTPVYGTLQDAWTSLPAWNALASNLPPDDFYPMLRDDAASFQENYVEVAQRMNTLFEFAQDTKFERNYNAGNEAFAQGEAAMYLQGSWAIPVIKGFEPDFEVGTFAYPTDSPEDTAVVSGVDVALTMNKDTPYAEEAMTFIEYLMSPDVMTSYVEEQSAIPTLKGLETPEPALEGLAPYFEDERVVGFSDHQIPPAIPLAEINQQFLISGNREAYLSELDEEWNKVARRQY